MMKPKDCHVFTIFYDPMFNRQELLGFKRREGQRNWKEKEKEEREG